MVRDPYIPGDRSREQAIEIRIDEERDPCWLAVDASGEGEQPSSFAPDRLVRYVDKRHIDDTSMAANPVSDQPAKEGAVASPFEV